MYYFADAVDMDRSAPRIRTCDFPKANAGEQAMGCFPIHSHCRWCKRLAKGLWRPEKY